MSKFSFLHFNGLPIFEQLQIEEALLRSDAGNWCIINMNAPPAIVMGISGKPEKLLNLDLVKQDRIPVIKRFSGGGTVYIDSETLFVTLICNHNAIEIAPQPRPILEWTEKLYKPLFNSQFALKENDYVIGDYKFGGNAQYIQKDRWLHHTSFLWDYQPEKMEYLLLPEKRPKYRNDRSHGDFLCRLRDHFPQKEGFLEKLTAYLENKLDGNKSSLESIQEILNRPHRKGTINMLPDLLEPLQNNRSL